MANIKVYIDEKKARKNGECLVYLIVHIDYNTIRLKTGVVVLKNNWDNETTRIKGNTKKARDGNLIIEKKLAQLNEIFVRYRLQNINITASAVKNEWLNPSRRIDFHAFFDEALEERKQDLAKTSYRCQKSVGTILKEYKPSLAFSEITPEFIEEFGRWLKTGIHKNKTNTVHAKMRTFRAYLYIAVRKKIIDENPFTKIKLKKETVNRIYLNKKELKDIWTLYKSTKLTPAKKKILRQFLFMCFTGIRVSDLRALNHDNIMEKMLVFGAIKTRNSTQNLIKVPLNKYSLELIKDEGTKYGKVFTMVSDQKINKYIKEIMLKVEPPVKKNVSNHTGRHTFASLWLEQTNDLAQLQALLGHSKITDTMIYVHIAESGLKKQMKNFEKSILG